jgi:hypothetical protein
VYLLIPIAPAFWFAKNFQLRADRAERAALSVWAAGMSKPDRFDFESRSEFVSEWLSDPIIEEAGRRIYESQQARLSDQTSFAAQRAWRSEDIPVVFWDSYREDARAALSLIGFRISTAGYDKDADSAGK